MEISPFFFHQLFRSNRIFRSATRVVRWCSVRWIIFLTRFAILKPEFEFPNNSPSFKDTKKGRGEGRSNRKREEKWLKPTEERISIRWFVKCPKTAGRERRLASIQTDYSREEKEAGKKRIGVSIPENTPMERYFWYSEEETRGNIEIRIREKEEEEEEEKRRIIKNRE